MVHPRDPKLMTTQELRDLLESAYRDLTEAECEVRHLVRRHNSAAAKIDSILTKLDNKDSKK